MEGISGLVAAVILLLITVAGGLIIYQMMMNYLGSVKQAPQVNVVAARLITFSNTSGLLSVVVSNMGTASANISSIEVYPSDVVSSVNCTSPPLAPGRTATITCNVTFLQGAPSTSTQIYASVVYDGNMVTDPVKVDIIS
ncbi:MAG: hypothetical protein ABWK00_06240 [Desulfurococcaceae archaeon]